MNKKRLEFLSLWAINDRLDLQALKDQLDELRLSGLDGVIFHPRNFPNEPEYMSTAYLEIVTDLIIYAKSTAMKFWIYDENGWPSGTANGQVLKQNPNYTCEWIEINRSEASQNEIVLTSFEESPGKTSHIELRARTNVSSLDSEATAQFIRLTHEAYRNGLSPEAFEYVTGFFSDEVAFLDGHSVTHQFGGIPWKQSFPEEYEARYGENLFRCFLYYSWRESIRQW